MYDRPLVLVSVAEDLNEYGESIERWTERKVFAEEQSIFQSEFYEANALGFKPELKFKLADYREYRGESKAIYGGQVYRILRTFRKGTTLEMVLTGGVTIDTA